MISLTFVILLTQVDLLKFFGMTHAIQHMTENTGVIWNANLFEVFKRCSCFPIMPCKSKFNLLEWGPTATIRSLNWKELCARFFLRKNFSKKFYWFDNSTHGPKISQTPSNSSTVPSSTFYEWYNKLWERKKINGERLSPPHPLSTPFHVS